MSGVDAQAVRAHVARITASDLFAGAERLCRFLRYTVESVLDGRAEQIKEYVLGREVFDRGDEYDTRLDPIVRVEARRLRSRLAEYYNGPGRGEPFQLEYPKGSYVPIVTGAGKAVSSAPLVSRWYLLLAGAIVLGLFAAAAYAYVRQPHVAVVAPIPARWIEPNDGTLDPVDATLAEDVDAQLGNNPSANVVAWPELVRDRNAMQSGVLRDVASRLGASRLLVVLVRNLPGAKNVNVFIMDEPSGRKRLALSYANPLLGNEPQQSALAQRIAQDYMNRIRSQTP